MINTEKLINGTIAVMEKLLNIGVDGICRLLRKLRKNSKTIHMISGISLAALFPLYALLTVILYNTTGLSAAWIVSTIVIFSIIAVFGKTAESNL